MSHSTFDRPVPGDWPTGARILLATVALETFVLLGYFLGTDATATVPRYAVYPFVWINVVYTAVLWTDVPRASRRHHLVAAAVAGGYFLLLANWGGLFELTGGGHHPVSPYTLGFEVMSGSPMLARIRFVSETVAISFIPFKVVGYLGLSFLVYAALLDVTGAVASGAVGFLSCLSCSFPIVASFVTGIWGGSVSLMGTVYPYSFDISTLAFLVSVGLLYWRPGFPSFGIGRDASPDASDE